MMGRVEPSVQCPECEKMQARAPTVCPRCGAMVFVEENIFIREWLTILLMLAISAGTVYYWLRLHGG